MQCSVIGLRSMNENENKGWKVTYGTIDILHRVVKKDLAETVLLEQTSEQNGKANASNVWERAFEGNSKSESPGSA